MGDIKRSIGISLLISIAANLLVFAGNTEITATPSTPSELGLVNTFEDTASYNGEVSFVMNDGSTKKVKFTSANDSIGHTDADGNKADSNDIGGGASKAYFIAWSNIPNYTGSKSQIEAGAKAFYTEEPISNAFPNGIDENSKLYPAYLSISSAMFLSSSLTGDIAIDRNLANEDIMYNKFAIKENSDTSSLRSVSFYMANDLNDNVKVNIGANFIMNPFIQAIARYSLEHYFQPGTAQFYGNHEYSSMTSTSKDVKQTQYTFIDLHVKIDDRIKINNNIKFAFDSYSFRPLMILDKDYNKIENANIETPIGTKRATISFDSNSSEFIIRTVLRKKSEIPDASFEEANNFNMVLVSLNDDTFTVKKEELDNIARGKAAPLTISGDISGGAQLYGRNFWGITLGGPTNIKKVEAKAIALDYKYNLVSFDKNSTDLGDNSEQDMGTSYVVHDKALATDSLNTGNLPSTDNTNYGDTIAAVPENIIKDGIVYKFSSWNTKADGSGEKFDENTTVSEDIKVYAIYSALTYDVHYEFISTDSSRALPKEILSRIPQDEEDKTIGSTVKPNESFDKSDLEVQDGKWIWSKWDPSEIVIKDKNVVFVGMWRFEEKKPEEPKKEEETRKPEEPKKEETRKPEEPKKSNEVSTPSEPGSRSNNSVGKTPNIVIVSKRETEPKTKQIEETNIVPETSTIPKEDIAKSYVVENKEVLRIPKTVDRNNIFIFVFTMSLGIVSMAYFALKRR